MKLVLISFIQHVWIGFNWTWCQPDQSLIAKKKIASKVEVFYHSKLVGPHFTAQTIPCSGTDTFLAALDFDPWATSWCRASCMTLKHSQNVRSNSKLRPENLALKWCLLPASCKGWKLLCRSAVCLQVMCYASHGLACTRKSCRCVDVAKGWLTKSSSRKDGCKDPQSLDRLKCIGWTMGPPRKLAYIV